MALQKDSWSYSITPNIDDVELREQCKWRDILNGEYVFTSTYGVELVNTFSKSDRNRKLYKGFEFLPKLSIATALQNTLYVRIESLRFIA